MRRFSPPPPPPSDAATVLEELVTHRVREKVQSELRQDRQELLRKMESLNTTLEKTLEKTMGTNFQAMNINLQALHTKIDSTKVDISARAAAFAFAGATAALSVVGFIFEKKVEMVDTKPVLS